MDFLNNVIRLLSKIGLDRYRNKKTILKFNSIASVRPSPRLALVVLSFVSFSQAFSADWVNEDYSSYTIGDLVGTNNTPSLLTSANSNNVIVNVGENKKLQYNKPTNSSGGTLYKLSPNLDTDRPQGYFSFKATIGTNTGTSYLMYVLGANDSNGMSGAASHYLQIRLYNTSYTTNQLRIYSGAGPVTNNPTPVWPTNGYSTLPTTENTFQVWYNKTASPMNYTNSSGVSNQVSPNSFVVYINGNLYGSNASSTGPLPSSVGTSSYLTTNTVGTNSVITTNYTPNSTIGKMGWWGGSSTQPYNVTFDNVYAGDSMPIVGNPPTITSSNSAVPLLNIPYTYQILTDPIGATSFALKSGTLPPGLSLNTTNGLISGTPSVLGGPTGVILTASNSVGEGATFNLSFTVNLPFNTFSGSNPSLNTDASWSLGAPPNSSGSIGSYLDVLLAPSVSDLTTISGSLFVKSWSVTNGSSYTLTSLKPDGSTTYQIGKLPTAAAFTNLVSGLANDLVYLANNSTLTFSPSNTSPTPTNSTVNLAYGGNLNISAGSTLNIDAVLTGTSATYGINKTGAGTLNLSGANTFGGSAAGTTLTAGTLNVNGSAAPTRLAQVQAVVNSGVVTGFTIINGGAGYTVAPTISISKSTGDTTGTNAVATATISNGVITAVTTTNGGTNYTLPPKVYVYSAQSPLGVGSNSFSGGILNVSVDTDISRMSTYADGTNTFFRINGTDTAFNGPTTLNVNSGKTLSCYTLAGNTNPDNMITKNGLGTLWLRGGGSTGFIGGFQVNAGTLYINVSANSGSGTSGTIRMNGGNLLLGKGIGSTGIYSALDISNTISVLADTTITLDPNPASATENNSCSTPLLQSSNRTITVAKTAAANAGAQMLFKSAELAGTTTFNVADATQVALCGAVGAGGVTKTGLGTLVLSALSSTNSTNNTYTGDTRINEGTVEFAPASSQDSSITVASNAVAKFTLGAITPTTSGSLTLSNGSKVRIIGTPSLGSYPLFTASNGINGNPQLEAPITGGNLNITNNSLILNVQKQIPTITVTTGTSYIYSGFPIDSASISVNKGGSQGLLTLSYVGVSTTYGPSSTPPTKAGIYTVTAAVEGDTTYQAANSLPATFTITPVAITGSFTASPKTYNGTSDAVVATTALSGVVGSDGPNVSLTGGTASFIDPNVGNGKTVTLRGAVLSGTAAANYSLTSVSTTTANITAATLDPTSITVAPPIAGLTYDGNAKAHVATATGVTSFTYSYAGRNGTLYGPLETAPRTAGFYAVTATSSDSNYTGSKSVDFTITKATPTISVAPTASPITVGQALSASILSIGSATGVGGVTVAGTFGWTSEGTIPSVTGSQGVTFTPTDTNYDTATTNVSVTVNPATPTGPTFTNTFGSLNPTSVGTDGLAYLMKYALGGTNTNDKVSLPTVALNGSTLNLTAVVRTNDTNVQIVGQWITGLGGTWSNVPTPSGTPSTNTNSVPTGCQRRDFSVPKDTNSRLFLRLKATQTP